jgi:hypothetical protein
MQTVHLDDSGVERLLGFPGGPDSGMVLDLGGMTSDMAAITRLVWALPDGYKIHFVSQPIAEATEGLAQSLREWGHEGDVDVLMREIETALGTFQEITSDGRPLVSLRIVTEEYLRKEYPSVSRHYHRDAATITLTKCFTGEGAIYLNEDNVKREFFGANSIAIEDAQAAHDPDVYGIVPPGAWLLLKGEVHPELDARNRKVFEYILGKGAELGEYNRGKALIHKGGRMIPGERRFVFTASTYKWCFQA